MGLSALRQKRPPWVVLGYRSRNAIRHQQGCVLGRAVKCRSRSASSSRGRELDRAGRSHVPARVYYPHHILRYLGQFVVG